MTELEKKTEKISIEATDYHRAWIDELYRAGRGKVRRSQIVAIALGRDWIEARDFVKRMVDHAN